MKRKSEKQMRRAEDGGNHNKHWATKNRKTADTRNDGETVWRQVTLMTCRHLSNFNDNQNILVISKMQFRDFGGDKRWMYPAAGAHDPEGYFLPGATLTW